MSELVLAEARVAGQEAPCDILIAHGRIHAIDTHIAGAQPRLELGGRLVLPGFVDTHVHLDKSCILDRCANADGSLHGAIAAVAAAKRGFTEADIYDRASRTLEKAILHGTMHMRTHVEVDPRIGLAGLNAILRLKRAYAWAIDLEICVFPQEGLLDDPGADAVLRAACGAGADLIGGCPYAGRDQHGHIARIFELAGAFDMDIDFHLDFDLDASCLHVGEVCRQAEAHGWQGRVTIGHASKLSALPPAALRDLARQLAAAGVAVTVLPATDLFLMGRAHDHNIPRGVAPAQLLAAQGVICSLATNNVLNPFTPFGDCALPRMANLFANIAQIGDLAGMRGCLEMITGDAARLMRVAGYGIAVGNPADLVVMDCTDAAMVVAEMPLPLCGLKRGRQSFSRTAATLHRPSAQPQDAGGPAQRSGAAC